MEKILLAKANASDAELISNTSWTDPNLVYRPVSTILHSIKYSNVFVLTHNKKTIAWIEIYKISRILYGISTLYVSPEYRGRALHRILIRAAMNRVMQFHIIVATSKPQIKMLLLKHGFMKTTFATLPPGILIRIICIRYFNLFTIWKYCTSAGKQLELFYRI